VHTIDAASRLLGHVGINPNRLSLEWVSAAEAPRFVSIVTAFSERITSLGPIGVKEGISSGELTFRLNAAKAVSQGEKFRWILGKKTEFAREGNVYGEVFSRHELGRLLEGLITEDFQVHEILQLLGERTCTVKEIAGRLGLQPSLVLMHLTALRRRKLAAVKEIKDGSPHYALCPEGDRKQHGC
jgi:DNA-binding transcriptional ArsR family regulator